MMEASRMDRQTKRMLGMKSGRVKSVLEQAWSWWLGVLGVGFVVTIKAIVQSADKSVER